MLGIDFEDISDNLSEMIKYAKLKKIRERQRSSECVAAFVILRDAPLPYEAAFSPYFILSNFDEEMRYMYGEQVFERVCNYLRILAAKKLYPHGDLKKQIIVKLEGKVGSPIESIQLTGEYFSSQQQDISQLKQLMEFLHLETKFALPNYPDEFYFPIFTQSISEVVTLDSIARTVQSIDEIDLINDIGKVYICQNQVLDTQAIFDNKCKKPVAQDDAIEFWIIMSRFCNEHTAVLNIHLLPAWLQEYVRYNDPVPLPKLFLNLVNARHPLERLRIILGLYPTEIKMFDFDVSVDAKMWELIMTLPVWYQERFRQIIYLSPEQKSKNADSQPVLPTMTSAQELIEYYAQCE